MIDFFWWLFFGIVGAMWLVLVLMWVDIYM